MNRNLSMGFACCTLLAACGGGGSVGSNNPPPAMYPVPNPPQGPSNASPGGYYTGTLTNSFANSNDGIIGLITENGDGVFIDSTHPAIYRLTASTSGNNLSATYRGYAGSGQQFANGASTDTGTIGGTVQERASIVGTYTGPNSSSGNINLTYQASKYAVSTPLASLLGTYQFMIPTSSGSNTITFTINSSSQVIGSDSSGCSINGSLSIPNTLYDAQQFKFGSTCSGTTQNFTGVSTYTPAAGSSPAYITLEYDDGAATAVVVNATKQ